MTNQFQKKYLFKFILCSVLYLPLFQVAAESLEDAMNCDKAGDNLCAYRILISHAEKNPKLRIMDDMFGTPNQFGQLLELQFILASNKMGDESIKAESNRVISLITSRHKHHEQTYIHLTPYYVIQAEACLKLQDKACIHDSTRHICRVLGDGAFSWSKLPEANKPLSGEKRAHKIKGNCKNTVDTARLDALQTKIDQLINSLESDDNFDQFASLYFLEETILKIKSRGKWDDFKKAIQEGNPQLLADLTYIKNQTPIIERSGDNHIAKFSLEPENSQSSFKRSMQFITKSGVWYPK